MKKKAKVVMLPTEDVSSIAKDIFHVKGCHKHEQLVAFPVLEKEPLPKHLSLEYQHLYITTDDEIKEGDYLIENNIIRIAVIAYGELAQRQISGGASATLMADSKKIIASSDRRLFPWVSPEDPRNGTGGVIHKGVMQISNEFIKLYCEQRGIDEVMVEYEFTAEGDGVCSIPEDKTSCICGGKPCYAETYWEPKINPDNTINISLIKESYSEEEAIQLLHKCVNDLSVADSNRCANAVNDWIKENL